MFEKKTGFPLVWTSSAVKTDPARYLRIHFTQSPVALHVEKSEIVTVSVLLCEPIPKPKTKQEWEDHAD